MEHLWVIADCSWIDHPVLSPSEDDEHVKAMNESLQLDLPPNAKTCLKLAMITQTWRLSWGNMD